MRERTANGSPCAPWHRRGLLQPLSQPALPSHALLTQPWPGREGSSTAQQHCRRGCGGSRLGCTAALPRRHHRLCLHVGVGRRPRYGAWRLSWRGGWPSALLLQLLDSSWTAPLQQLTVPRGPAPTACSREDEAVRGRHGGQAAACYDPLPQAPQWTDCTLLGSLHNTATSETEAWQTSVAWPSTGSCGRPRCVV